MWPNYQRPNNKLVKSVWLNAALFFGVLGLGERLRPPAPINYVALAGERQRTRPPPSVIVGSGHRPPARPGAAPELLGDKKGIAPSSSEPFGACLGNLVGVDLSSWTMFSEGQRTCILKVNACGQGSRPPDTLHPIFPYFTFQYITCLSSISVMVFPWVIPFQDHKLSQRFSVTWYYGLRVLNKLDYLLFLIIYMVQQI